MTTTQKRKRAKTALLQGLLVSVWFLGTGNSLEAAPEIKVKLNPPHTVKAEETCHLTLEVMWRSGEGDYRFRKPELALDNLVVEEEGESSEAFHREGEAWKKKTFRFQLKASRPGKASILPFRLDYVDPLTQAGGQFEIQAWPLTVVPDRSRLYQGIGIASVVAAVCFLGFRFFIGSARKKRTRVPSSESALEDRYISRLVEWGEKVESRVSVRDRLFKTSQVFRAYLSEKFSVSGATTTSQEILAEITGRVPADELRVLKKIFDKLDQWRYTASARSEEDGRQLHEDILRYIEGKRVVLAQ